MPGKPAVSKPALGLAQRVESVRASVPLRSLLTKKMAPPPSLALLLRMSNELKMRAELQTYARSLLHELQQMYLADEQSGKSGEELQSRLKGNLDYARSIFESRVALEGSDTAALLDDELASLVEAEQSAPFARDLAVAAGRPELAQAKQTAAEAS